MKQNLSTVSVQQIELKDSENLEAYQEILSLFYCGHDDQVQARLLNHGVPRVVAILKVSRPFITLILPDLFSSASLHSASFSNYVNVTSVRFI